MTDTSTSASSAKPPFYAFATKEADLAVIRQFAESHRWPTTPILQGDIATGTDYLRTHAPPALMLVEISDAKAAPDLLSRLADVCDPDTRVLVIGDINEYSFYCWLMEIGVFSYLLKPLTTVALQHAWEKTQAPQAGGPAAKTLGQAIGVIGARGGVGATSVSLYLAAILAESGRKTALIDLDPQDGSVSLLLDLEPSRGLRDAMERPERIDALFLDRVMQQTEQEFHVLSAEESIAAPVPFHEQAADTLMRELRQKFELLVLDVPRGTAQFYRDCLKACNRVFAVTDLSLLGLRDSLRLLDLFRDHLQLPPPVFIANQVGRAPKYEMSVEDFTKGLNAKIDLRIPSAPDVFMTIGAELPALRGKTPAMKALRQLADMAVPPAEEEAPEQKKHGWLKK